MDLIGKSIGVYHITALLGTGGMGEVYRARDTRLGCDVAIKVLPPAFTSDPDRLARFEREARLMATLNHPHIAAIYGFEDASGVPALVLELVEGQTLAERVSSGPVPVAEALAVARQIAEALEAAHHRGIVHRDLKPANIKVTPDATAKVLDFGLAKAGGAARNLSQFPTVTSGTLEGMILGTAAYMSPEPARGQAVDQRTDIWAFGCVLYETLTGRVAFAGATISDTIAAILEREPDWQKLPRSTPARVRNLLRRCLQKDPETPERPCRCTQKTSTRALRRRPRFRWRSSSRLDGARRGRHRGKDRESLGVLTQGPKRAARHESRWKTRNARHPATSDGRKVPLLPVA